MADTSLLRSSAIVRNASVGTSPPHGPVKTGELPLVQVRQPPGGPQVQEGQQRPVTILPSKDPNSAVTTGALPMVQVKMTQNGPQPDDGRDSPVVIKNNRQTVAAGNLPMVQVKMESGKPQVQNIPNVQGGPPQIPSAAPALSAPRIMQSAQGPRVARIAAPQLAAPPLPEVPELSTDQLMLCQHLVNKYLAEVTEAESIDEEIATVAKSTAAAIDDMLVAVSVRAEAVARAAAVPPPAPVPNAYVAPRPITGGHFSPAALSPQPAARNGYVMQRPGVRKHGSSGLAPRGYRRPQPGEPTPPMVQVNMDGQRPVVQNQAELAAATQAAQAEDSQPQG